jgi:hypothetical protein
MSHPIDAAVSATSIWQVKGFTKNYHWFNDGELLKSLFELLQKCLKVANKW